MPVRDLVHLSLDTSNATVQPPFTHLEILDVVHVVLSSRFMQPLGFNLQDDSMPRSNMCKDRGGLVTLEPLYVQEINCHGTERCCSPRQACQGPDL